MIVITPFGSGSPLTGRPKGVTFHQTRSKSVAEALRDALVRFPDEREAFVYVAPGGRVSTAPIYKYLQGASFDVAACVDRIGSTPREPRQFDGIGRVSLETLVVRRTPGAQRLLARWSDRNASWQGREDVNLCVALAETKDVRFAFLGADWRWRPGDPGTKHEATVWFDTSVSDLNVTRPVTEKKDPPAPKQPVAKGPGVLQSGHFLSYASYGRLNREILFRVANTLTVRIQSDAKESVLVDEYMRARVEPFYSTLIDQKSPILRIFGPDHEPQGGRFSICYTLMETSRVHEDMVSKINKRYNELWTCTTWGRNAFVESGVRVPTRIVPLGIDPMVFRPGTRGKLPECTLVSTSRRGLRAVPSGWSALAVGLPSRRKNFEFSAEAFDDVFGSKRDVNFIIATTHAPGGWLNELTKFVSKMKSRIWILDGQFTDWQMAEIYNAVDVVVSASLGEGWFLPGHEGAACGKPVVVPSNSVHPEVFGADSWMFDGDGEVRIPEVESVSPWYVGAKWPVYGRKSRRQLSGILEEIHAGGAAVRGRAERQQLRLSRLTWDKTAAMVTERLLEVQK